MRSDWETLARAAVERGMALVLVCDGAGLREHEERLRGYFQGISVRLEGTASTHDLIQQRSGSFERAVDGLQALAQAGIPCGVITTVSNHNIGDLDAIRAVVQEMGVGDWLVRMTFASGALRRPGHAAYTLPPGDVLTLIKYISDLRKTTGMGVVAGCDIGYNVEEMSLRPAPWAGCPAGIWSACIESNGNVKGCACLPDEFLEGNVRDEVLADIWGDPARFAYNRRFDPQQMTGYCRVCPHSYTCGCGCVGSAWASTGTRFDNIYCYQRLAHEMEFIRSHPDGGTAHASELLDNAHATRDELFRIFRALSGVEGI